MVRKLVALKTMHLHFVQQFNNEEVTLEKLRRNFIFTRRQLDRYKGCKVPYLLGFIEAALMALILPILYELISMLTTESNKSSVLSLFRLRHLLMAGLIFLFMNVRYYLLIKQHNVEIMK